MNETTKKKYETVGIVPKFDFKDEAGRYVEGSYVRKQVVKQTDKAGKDKSFNVWIVADDMGREWTLSGGHLDYLFERALKEKGLTGGQGVRVTYTGWDELDDGNKCRTYSLELEKA